MSIRTLESERLIAMPRRLEMRNTNLANLYQLNVLMQTGGSCFAGCPQVGLQLNLGAINQVIAAPVINVNVP